MIAPDLQFKGPVRHQIYFVKFSCIGHILNIVHTLYIFSKIIRNHRTLLRNEMEPLVTEPFINACTVYTYPGKTMRCISMSLFF